MRRRARTAASAAGRTASSPPARHRRPAQSRDRRGSSRARSRVRERSPRRTRECRRSLRAKAARRHAAAAARCARSCVDSSANSAAFAGATMTRASSTPSMPRNPASMSPPSPARVCASMTACGVSTPMLASASPLLERCGCGRPASESRSKRSLRRPAIDDHVVGRRREGHVPARQAVPRPRSSCSECSGAAKSATRAGCAGDRRATTSDGRKGDGACRAIARERLGSAFHREATVRDVQSCCYTCMFKHGLHRLRDALRRRRRDARAHVGLGALVDGSLQSVPGRTRTRLRRASHRQARSPSASSARANAAASPLRMRRGRERRERSARLS